MPSLKKLDDLLTQSTKLLDEAVSQIRDIPFEPAMEQIKKIGMALSYIAELQHAIYKTEPSLTPDFLKEPSPYPGENKKFGNILIEANKLCDEGDFNEAIELFENYMLSEPPELFITMARNQIEGIRKGLK
ncbi:MAG: hypothetical protein OEV42_08495 [Deltaproteobacteria bacterium]|nr:hypothetical protein [Deltaproteobacteria bacterium]